jgi:hypothetical protein
MDREDSLEGIPAVRQRRLAIAWPAAGVLALLLLLAVGRPPDDSLAWRTVYDLGHVPLFGSIALFLLRIFRILRPPHRRPWVDFLLALLATVVLSLASEAAQVGQPGREASVGDALNNLTGAICFLAIAASLRPRLWNALDVEGRPTARLVLVAAVLALAVALSPLVTVAWHYAMRRAAVPVVVEMGSRWQLPFISAPRATVERVQAPGQWAARSGKPVARVLFLDAAWPGVTVREPWPDWSDYATLRFDVWSELTAPVELALRVDDGNRIRDYGDRYNGSLIVMPGANEFALSLSTLMGAPRDRQMNLADIAQLVLFTRRPGEPFELYISDVWLEREPGNEEGGASP